MRFIGAKVEQETSAPPPKKNPGSAPVLRFVTGTELYKACTWKVYFQKQI